MNASLYEITKKISIIGAGAWGTAIAIQLCKNVDELVIVTRRLNVANAINTHKKNISLPSFPLLPKNLISSTNIQDIQDSQCIVISIASQDFKDTLLQLRSLKISKEVIIVIATKGLLTDGSLLSSITSKILGNRCAILAGPNLAIEVACDMPSHTVVGADTMPFALEVSKLISTDSFVAHPTTDIVSLQIASCVKNVAAILSGMSDGLEYGANNKSWIVALALEEIEIFSKQLSSQCKVIQSKVVGDLSLCCNNSGSRNNTFGNKLAQTPKEKRMDFINDYPILTEGRNNLLQLTALANRLNLKSNLCSVLSNILEEPENLESHFNAITRLKDQ
ncbi:NAD(P)H-dependent glycerol-3-phosphate dehydrogenase [Candidatus Sneabacter namystus]|uniref:Glycerol-3-phosphate dehydrogenase n=1 Tax=Candidatus Sneabacter namystus TaxID=2601646 RepID=A0A5C0UIZ7_9RICK|nr:NAD(P)H-dependent glycerol-3-phosphate dehydrogenase [Candidatus Sneabacter namystus]QEK39483.1 hypothetical protein FZC37_00825 [Candidatus Sneabacter namystus]